MQLVWLKERACGSARLPRNNPSRSVKGLTVLVTGAASGMGRATARVFAADFQAVPEARVGRIDEALNLRATYDNVTVTRGPVLKRPDRQSQASHCRSPAEKCQRLSLWRSDGGSRICVALRAAAQGTRLGSGAAHG